MSRGALTRLTLLALCGCISTPPAGELTLSPSPRIIADNGQASVLTLYATDGAGAPGAGTVALSTDLGLLSARQVTLEADGTTTVQYTCDRTLDPLCTARTSNLSALITGRWTPLKGAVVESSIPMTIRPTYPDGG
jgi:hypothetical protein